MLVRLVLFMLVVAAPTGTAFPQSSNIWCDITGTVRDIAGGAIYGAHVTLKGPFTLKGRDNRTTQTDKNGEYTFKNLRRGAYNVRFELAGFLPTVSKVSIGDKPVRADAVLRVPPIID